MAIEIRWVGGVVVIQPEHRVDSTTAPTNWA